MCTKPILIQKRNFRYLVYSKKIVVPCGDCDECLRKRANDLYLRARLEYDICLRNGGTGFMCCLTYSDDLLPILHINGTPFMVFNKKHVIDFLKRLRTNLDRKYIKVFGHAAPDFKYLVTSEYGSDPTRSHRPHYHLLFFFRDSVSYTLFKQCFLESTFCRVLGKDLRYFGKILQCDVIDPKRGGIQYSAKYICKDLMYKFQSDYIKKQIKFNKDRVNAIFGILPSNSADNDFFNRCVRSRTDYKKAVETYVRPWRHMLQFFMLSNDLGASAAVMKYGRTLETMPTINFDGFPYAIPKQVKLNFEKNYGTNSLVNLIHSAFINTLSTIIQTYQVAYKLTVEEGNDILLFARTYCRPVGGRIRIILPDSFDALNLEPFKDWELICNEFQFFEENDFFVIRDRIQQLFRDYNSPGNLNFRAQQALDKNIKEKQDYDRKKRNKNV